jgi:DNA-directed RNA polymerase specialized sigma24 family protein
MQPTDDSALLRQYAENNSDEAFAALVTRHVNLVYSVALRQVGNPHHAEEITQVVFIILAKKAVQLRHDKALSSWLFQATRLTANNFIRSEARRHRREEEVYMQSVLDETGTEVWPKLHRCWTAPSQVCARRIVKPLCSGFMKAGICGMSVWLWA